MYLNLFPPKFIKNCGSQVTPEIDHCKTHNRQSLPYIAFTSICWLITRNLNHLYYLIVITVRTANISPQYLMQYRIQHSHLSYEVDTIIFPISQMKKMVPARLTCPFIQHIFIEHLILLTALMIQSGNLQSLYSIRGDRLSTSKTNIKSDNTES